MRAWRRPFFKHHFSDRLSIATNFLFGHSRKPKILDLGCGVGTQSLFYAALGAEVISIDMDTKSLDILRKRRDIYQQACGRQLNISLYNANALEFDYQTISPLDGIFSMFAFNMMQPSSALIPKLAASLKSRGRLVIMDGNRSCWINRFFRRRQVLSPVQLVSSLEKAGIKIIQHEGCYAVPPFLWAFTPTFLIKQVDRFLTKTWFFSVTHQVFGENIVD